MRLRTVLFGLVGSLLCALAVEAQLSTGNIIGSVRDESGAVLPGVTATLTSPLLPGGPQTLVTNEQGEYRFTGLVPGAYALRVELPGFNTYEETDLQVRTGGTTERIVTLKVAAVAETITVSGQAPVVDTRQSGIANSIPSELRENLAFERYGVQGFMAMLPGVTTSGYNRVFSVTVMGSNANETTILTDGVSINNVRSGGSWLLSDFDGASELSVTTLGASAEYQAAGGGVMNVVGKTGTNRFSGDASAFWSPDALSDKGLKLPCSRCGDGSSTPFKWYRYHDVSGHLGGPIRPDRLWFFSGLIFRGRTGTQPGQPVPPEDQKFLDWITDTNTKVTWRINDKAQFQQTYYAEIWGTVNPNFTSPTRPIETLQHSQAGIKDDPNPGSQLTWTLTPTTVLTARYNLTMGASRRIGFFRDLDTPQTNDSAFGQSGNTNAHRFWPRRDEVNAKLNTYISGERMSHSLGYGVQVSRSKSVFVQIQPGGVTYSTINRVPNQASFNGPDAQGAVSKAQGVWAEDELTMGRVTVKLGGRYDRMVGTSSDIPQFDLRFNEVGTLAGLGKLVTWNTFSPRVGANVRLTGDSKTVLRVVAGRYYLPLFLGEFETLHPGRAITDLYGYEAATAGYTRFISRTDPRAQIRIDSDMKAPYTDQFSIGVDREIANNLGVGINVVHKRSGNQLGWKDIGGIYGSRDVTLANGQTLTVFPLLNRTSDRLFLRTNGDGYYSRYNALILTATKRLANRWAFNAGYTRQRSKGLELSGINGRDPNDFINADGGLDSRDRPHMLSLMGSYEIPKIAVQVSGNLTAVSGTAINSTAQITGLPQGTRTVRLEPAGSKYRTPNEKFMHVRFTKIMFRSGPRRFELTGEVKNALNERGSPAVQSTVFNAATFLLPNTYPEPRQLRIFVRAMF